MLAGDHHHAYRRLVGGACAGKGRFPDRRAMKCAECEARRKQMKEKMEAICESDEAESEVVE